VIKAESETDFSIVDLYRKLCPQPCWHGVDSLQVLLEWLHLDAPFLQDWVRSEVGNIFDDAGAVLFDSQLIVSVRPVGILYQAESLDEWEAVEIYHHRLIKATQEPALSMQSQTLEEGLEIVPQRNGKPLVLALVFEPGPVSSPEITKVPVEATHVQLHLSSFYTGMDQVTPSMIGPLLHCLVGPDGEYLIEVRDVTGEFHNKGTLRHEKPLRILKNGHQARVKIEVPLSLLLDIHLAELELDIFGF